jgi:hypothetical protein
MLDPIPCIWIMGLVAMMSLSELHSLMERVGLGASIGDWLNCCWSLDCVKSRHALYVLRVVS